MGRIYGEQFRRHHGSMSAAPLGWIYAILGAGATFVATRRATIALVVAAVIIILFKIRK